MLCVHSIVWFKEFWVSCSVNCPVSVPSPGSSLRWRASISSTKLAFSNHSRAGERIVWIILLSTGVQFLSQNFELVTLLDFVQFPWYDALLNATGVILWRLTPGIKVKARSKPDEIGSFVRTAQAVLLGELPGNLGCLWIPFFPLRLGDVDSQELVTSTILPVSLSFLNFFLASTVLFMWSGWYVSLFCCYWALQYLGDDEHRHQAPLQNIWWCASWVHALRTLACKVFLLHCDYDLASHLLRWPETLRKRILWMMSMFYGSKLRGKSLDIDGHFLRRTTTVPKGLESSKIQPLTFGPT